MSQLDHIELLDATLQDALTVCSKLPPGEREVYEAITGAPYQAEDAAIAAMRASFRWVLAHACAPVAIFGFAEHRPGVYGTFCFATDMTWAKPYGLDATRYMRRAISRLLETNLAHRIETVTLADRSRARDWYPKIGLRLESTLPGYGARGEDAVRYVALRSERN